MTIRPSAFPARSRSGNAATVNQVDFTALLFETPSVALVKCRECSGTVADDAKACPHCGTPKPWLTERPMLFKKAWKDKWASGIYTERLIVWGFIAFLVFAWIYGNFFHPDLAEGDKRFYDPAFRPD
jgi:hypothetical protein